MMQPQEHTNQQPLASNRAFRDKRRETGGAVQEDEEEEQKEEEEEENADDDDEDEEEDKEAEEEADEPCSASGSMQRGSGPSSSSMIGWMTGTCSSANGLRRVCMERNLAIPPIFIPSAAFSKLMMAVAVAACALPLRVC